MTVKISDEQTPFTKKQFRALREKVQAKPRVCDPSYCEECLYLGDGAFICDEHLKIVVADWQPTENYLICQQGGQDK